MTKQSKKIATNAPHSRNDKGEATDSRNDKGEATDSRNDKGVCLAMTKNNNKKEKQ